MTESGGSDSGDKVTKCDQPVNQQQNPLILQISDPGPTSFLFFFKGEERLTGRQVGASCS